MSIATDLDGLPRRVARWAKSLGPGLITGAADDDPSGIATYSITGASTGLSMLWAALVTTPMMAVIDGTCARIGLVTGAGLMWSLVRSMPRVFAIALALLVGVANTFNVGADLNAMAVSAHLLAPVPMEVWLVFFAAVIVVVEVFFTYRAFADIMRWLCIVLFAYIITAFVVHANWPVVLLNLIVPHVRWNAGWLTTLTAALGTTITPYLFFWQTSMTAEERQARRTANQDSDPTPRRVADAHADANTGAIYSNLVMFFIIVTCASTLGAHGSANIATAQDAAEALRPLAGNFAFTLFTIGIVGTGLLAVPVLAGSSGYMFAELWGWREGLDLKPNRARGFYTIIVLGVAAGATMGLFHLDPIKALFWCAVLNGIAAVPLLYAIIRIARDHRVLGKWVISRTALVWLWLAFGLLLLSALGTFASPFISTS
ncbi:MAG TPA: divalent metal cation transporter [Candidatus Baltobacteraceae bacterium]|nr:divalent metal cation transporter [Candidatus Baltobacteraceae bacterium]